MADKTYTALKVRELIHAALFNYGGPYVTRTESERIQDMLVPLPKALRQIYVGNTWYRYNPEYQQFEYTFLGNLWRASGVDLVQLKNDLDAWSDLKEHPYVS